MEGEERGGGAPAAAVVCGGVTQHQPGPARPLNPLFRAPGGRVFVMTKEEVENVPNVVTPSKPAPILFDSGATHSFTSTRLVRKMQGTLTSRHSILSIALPDGKVVNCQELFVDCPILVHNHEFLADLYRFELTEFDIILGMDWLSKHQAQIDCIKQKITLRGPKGEKIVHKGKPRGSGV